MNRPTTATMSQLHVDALTWAGWGFNIGPLNGKIPRVKGAYRAFTSDIDQINRWWSRWPESNIGCRPMPWAVVLDLDPRNGSEATWEQINRGHEHDVPETLTTVTGSGGQHLWYRLPYRPEHGLKATAGAGIDIQHHGKGQVVMPGSIHPDTGRAYEVGRWLCPHLLPELPEHLRRHVYRPPPPPPPVLTPGARSRAAEGLIRKVEKAPDGDRNRLLNWAAYTARRKGLDLDAELTSAALSTGLDEAEIRATLASAKKADITNEFQQ